MHKPTSELFVFHVGFQFHIYWLGSSLCSLQVILCGSPNAISLQRFLWQTLSSVPAEDSKRVTIGQYDLNLLHVQHLLCFSDVTNTLVITSISTSMWQKILCFNGNCVISLHHLTNTNSGKLVPYHCTMLHVPQGKNYVMLLYIIWVMYHTWEDQCLLGRCLHLHHPVRNFTIRTPHDIGYTASVVHGLSAKTDSNWFMNTIALIF